MLVGSLFSLFNDTNTQGSKMLERKALIEEITSHFSFLQLFIETSSTSGLVDVNIISEDFVASILNASHKWNLANINHISPNTKCIDLLDTDNRIGVQVSSRIDSSKIKSTIVA
ncbi:SMEK domain-containing protein [Pseudomonas sp. NPDC087814]|uniref:SMEK domain-containing protein n=1 Tax=Pseudomonas sp. NPDC087814 TaxID=3364450 RepID=UPI00381581BD